MLSKLSGFFKDTGDLSMTRLMSFLSLIVASLIAVYGIIKGSDLSALAVLVGSFLLPAFGGKVMGSYAEKNTGDKNE